MFLFVQYRPRKAISSDVGLQMVVLLWMASQLVFTSNKISMLQTGNFIIIDSQLTYNTMQIQLQAFLTEEQAKMLSASIQTIIRNLTSLPVRLTAILTQCQKANIKYLQDIDPEGGILIQKLTQINEQALYKHFEAIGQSIIKIIAKNAPEYENQHSLRFLRGQISDEVNRICQSNEFHLRIEHKHGNFGDSLWDSMHDEIIQIAMGICGFMHNHYEMILHQGRREVQIEMFLQSFRNKFEGKVKLSKLYVLTERLQVEMSQKRNESILMGDVEENEDLIQLMQQIDYNQQIEEEKQIKQLQNQISNENGGVKNNTNILWKIKQKAQNAFHSVKTLVSKKSSEQKQLPQISDSLEEHLQNLQTCHQIADHQKKQIQKIGSLSLKQIEDQLVGQLTHADLSIVKYSINHPIKKWYQYQNSIGNENALFNEYTCLLVGYSQKLMTNFEKLKAGNTKTNNAQFLLAALFFKTLQSEYCVFAKRYLSRVLRIIQKEFIQSNNIHLRGVLRILQASTIKATKMADLLYNQKPFRSKSFEQSNKSLLHLSNNIYQDNKKVKLLNYQWLKQIKFQKNLSQDIPRIDIDRLNFSPQSKTITIVISGWLSEDSQRDKEWLGLIRVLENTQIYGLGWQSSTIKESKEYLAKLATQFVLNPVNLSGPLGMIGNAINIGCKIVNQYKGNPFAIAHNRASVTGLYLAQLLVKIFPDRFINLVSFSLGTEVLVNCLGRLASQGKLNMINKVVTIGAATSQQNIKRVLQDSNVSIELKNIWSQGDHAVRYLYRLCRLGSLPLGAADLAYMSGHQILNINSSKFIKSHLQFRDNLYGIGLLTGLIHD